MNVGKFSFSHSFWLFQAYYSEDKYTYPLLRPNCEPLATTTASSCCSLSDILVGSFRHSFSWICFRFAANIFTMALLSIQKFCFCCLIASNNLTFCAVGCVSYHSSVARLRNFTSIKKSWHLIVIYSKSLVISSHLISSQLQLQLNSHLSLSALSLFSILIC